tara:strand:- start:2446 stop:2847 length:402 start_codon:yes stop_codon:yes gene_type:complete
MIVSGSFDGFKNSIYDMEFLINSPESGFDISLRETGVSTTNVGQIINFSGVSGYLFDQSGNFFAGYESGVSFKLKTIFDHSNRRFSYYHNDYLIANLDTTGQGVVDNGTINSVVFEKHGTSTVSIVANGIKAT